MAIILFHFRLAILVHVRTLQLKTVQATLLLRKELDSTTPILPVVLVFSLFSLFYRDK